MSDSKHRHIHYGILTARPANPAEIETGKAWAITNPDVVVENRCATCGQAL